MQTFTLSNGASSANNPKSFLVNNSLSLVKGVSFKPLYSFKPLRFFLILCFFCSLAFVPSTSKAESSAAFVGVELGYGEGRVNTDIAYLRGVQYGITAGYKQFFMPYVGLRYYANFSVMHAPGVYNKDGNENPDYEKKTTSLLNYGVNVDFLANFVAGEDFDFGAFVGVGVGAYTWLKSGYLEIAPSEWKLTHLDVALNVGLRTNIAKNHGIEVVGRVSFLDGNVYSAVINGTNTGLDVSHPYSVTARYTYSF